MRNSDAVVEQEGSRRVLVIERRIKESMSASYQEVTYDTSPDMKRGPTAK
jgi:hypothetical protein